MAIPAGGYLDEAAGLADGLLYYYPCFDDQFEPNRDTMIDIVSGFNLNVRGDRAYESLVKSGNIGLGYSRDMTPTVVQTEHVWIEAPFDPSDNTRLLDWTLALWFYPKSIVYASVPTILNTATGAGIELAYRSNQFEVSWTGGSLTTTVINPPPANNAKHLVVVTSDYALTQVKVFMDGVLQDTQTANYQTLDLYSTMWFVGGYAADATSLRYFDGEIDELAIFNRPIADAEVTTLWNAGSGMDLIQFANANRVLVGEGLGNKATASYGWGVTAASTFGQNHTPDENVNMVADASDNTGSNAALVTVVHAVVAVDETTGATATYDVNSRLKPLVEEGYSFASSLSIAGETYEATVLNTSNFAVTEFSNYPFDAYAKLDGKVYASGADGIYLLEGSDDDGALISASLKTRVTDFGGEAFARCERAYLFLRNSKPVALKAITRDNRTGNLQEDWYELDQTDDSLRKERIKLGRGLKSHTYQFSLQTMQGGDLDLHGLEFVPIVLTRRI